MFMLKYISYLHIKPIRGRKQNNLKYCTSVTKNIPIYRYIKKKYSYLGAVLLHQLLDGKMASSV